MGKVDIEEISDTSNAGFYSSLFLSSCFFLPENIVHQIMNRNKPNATAASTISNHII
ncbi:hypothetical protein SAMN05421510_101550 [Nitrosomonas ureae]|uniref:Uncharacterized protein n=1 Tax=Nitrosomonas ureae TaxID=44577 RepID=A0A1H9CKZ1_9PROT|nr:hypothetical protein C8R27_10175 [Nitrosomonas ureae]SEQ01829.1 hypothetical protein SAMN05421510_101550 [Nitrosomonas ureae]SOD17212.1 hypothetical protein SAMN06297164_1066 [Nitrosomonas ureae]